MPKPHIPLEDIRALREEFWADVKVLGAADDFNQSLEKAHRVADFIELGELMCIDALHRRLPGAGNDCIHVLSGQLRLIPRCLLERVHSLTPVVVKTERGYWRNQMQLVEYEERLKENLIRKYNFFQHASLSGDFLLFRDIAFMNRKPVRVAQSDISLLGDKVSLKAASNDTAQELLYMALGTGMGENNARGCGFLGYRFR